MKYNGLIIAILLLSTLTIFFIQFLTPTLYEADGYLHIRMAEFLRDLGPRYNFHWAKFSTFNRHFADKDFLYHLILIPFLSFRDIFFGAKLAAAIFAVLLFSTYYLLLRKYSDKIIASLFIFAFFFSANFLDEISRARPLTIVILITLLAIYLLMCKRYLWVLLTGLFYALIHVTSPLIILYSVIIETVRYFDRKEFCLRNILAAFSGVALGFIVHPNFPNNFIVFYLNSILVPFYTLKTGVLELGAEFFPLNTREYLLGYPVVIIWIVSVIYMAVSKRPRPRFETKVFLTLAMIFFILSFICRRYLGHGYLIILLAFAAYMRDFLEVEKSINKAVVVLISILALPLGINSYVGVRYNALVANVINGHYEAVAKWMENNIPEGELVFHANWSDSQYFIGLNPKNDYFVTLDPVYMYKNNPQLYSLYRDVALGRTNDPYNVLRATFNVRFGYAGKNYFNKLIEQIRADTRFTILAEDDFGIIFKLI